MRITDTGNVSIGTTAPVSNLEIVSTNQVSSGDGNLSIRSSDSMSINKGGFLSFGGSYSGTLRTVFAGISGRKENSTSNDIAGYLSLETSSSTLGSIERMRITSAGNVGIGTTNTQGYKLAVAGNMIAEEVKVKLQGTWPDYVFNTDYSLMPLKEIKAYVQENKHLPEVPSAKEIEKNGINLSEMNMLLLKKVEELTLHLIII